MRAYMDVIVIAAVVIAVVGHLARNLLFRHEHGRMRDQMLAQLAALLIFSFLQFLTVIAARAGSPEEMIVLLDLLTGLASALSAVLGIAVVDYLVKGRWRRGWYLLALVALFPRWGHAASAVLWLVQPMMLWKASRLAREEDARVRMQTIYCGTLGGGLLGVCLECLRLQAAMPMAVEVVAPLASALFLYAGLHTRRDPENEFSYPEITSFVRFALPAIIAAAVLPCAFMNASDFHILRQLLEPGLGVAACILIALLIVHFEASGIRIFLILLLVSFSVTAVSNLYSGRFGITLFLGLRLISRVTLVLASLFILKQYMRWGFEIAQAMVMIITAVSSASVVFLVMYLLQPLGAFDRFQEEEMILAGILFLDLVVLLSLPPVLVNYNFGTMKTTWAVFSFGILLEVYGDFLSPMGERYERDLTGILAKGLIMLAFTVLWRYTSVLMRGVNSVSNRLDAT